MADIDLSMLWEGLKLIEEEEDVAKLSDQSILEASLRGKNYLMALIISNRGFNKEAFHTTMPQVWKLEGWIKFIKVGDSRFIMEFQMSVNKEKVLHGGLGPSIDH